MEKMPKSASPKKTKNPTYEVMIQDSIKALKERKGASRQALKKYIEANYKCEVRNPNKLVTDGNSKRPKPNQKPKRPPLKIQLLRRSLRRLKSLSKKPRSKFSLEKTGPFKDH